MTGMTNTEPAGADYAAWLNDLKAQVASARQRAALVVSRELVLLYWQIGRDIAQRQKAQGWGAKVIDRLARDLRSAFPDMRGFSRRNLKCMRAFAQAWPDGEICAAGCCTIAVVPFMHAARQTDHPGGA